MNSGRPRYDHELLGSSFAHNAELAAVPPPQGPQNIVTPCHGAAISAVKDHNDEVEIYCTHEGCSNLWDFDGLVVYWREAE